MIKYEVKDRFIGKVKFTAEIDCNESDTLSAKVGLAVKWAIENNADLSYANLSYANLRYANLSYANLRYANLSYADLRSANLRSANLSSANLSSADLRSANLRYVEAGNSNEIKTIQDSKYRITYTATYMAIGCQQHTIEQWFKFSDKEISAMDNGALKWWNKWKPILAAIMGGE